MMKLKKATVSQLSEATRQELRDYAAWIEYVERNFEDLLVFCIRRSVFVVLKMTTFQEARKKTLFFLAREAHEDSWLMAEKLFYYCRMFCYKPMMRHAKDNFYETRKQTTRRP